MPSAVTLRTDFSMSELRRLAKGLRTLIKAFVACGYWRGYEPRRRGEDRRHGSSDVARLGSSVQRGWP
jgi:hypothetical protein